MKMLDFLKNLFGSKNNNKTQISKPKYVKAFGDRVIHCNMARIFTGKVTSVGNWGNDYERNYRYNVISGKVKIRKLKAITLHRSWGGTIKFFMFYPVTGYAEIEANGTRIMLHKYNGYGKKMIYKQKLRL
ncbi:hypothetical protein [Methanosarcina barkeri]|nr:hypothetical protein [Methanosarcina barkeri]